MRMTLVRCGFTSDPNWRDHCARQKITVLGTQLHGLVLADIARTAATLPPGTYENVTVQNFASSLSSTPSRRISVPFAVGKISGRMFALSELLL